MLFAPDGVCSNRFPCILFLGRLYCLRPHQSFINLIPVLIAQYVLSYRIILLTFPCSMPRFRGVVRLCDPPALNFTFGCKFVLLSNSSVSNFIANNSQQKQWRDPRSSFWSNFPGPPLPGRCSIEPLAIAAPCAPIATLCLCEPVFGPYIFARFHWGGLAMMGVIRCSELYICVSLVFLAVFVTLSFFVPRR